MSATVRVVIQNNTNSGNRRGWTKLVTAVDTSKTNGYAFEGRFLPDGEHDLPIGAVVIEKNPEGSAKHGWDAGVCYTVGADGGLYREHDGGFRWDRQFLSFRDLVARTLAASQAAASAPETAQDAPPCPDAAPDGRDAALAEFRALAAKYGFTAADLIPEPEAADVN